MRSWDVAALKQIRNYSNLTDEVRQIALNPDETQIAIGGNAGRVSILDIETGKVVAESKDQIGQSIV